MTKPSSFLDRMRHFAHQIGASDFGVYFVVGEERITVPLSLTTGAPLVPPTGPEPLSADPLPGSPTCPEE